MSALANNANLSRPALLLTLGVAALLVGATLGLWGYYGTTVFFEMVRAGFIACF